MAYSKTQIESIFKEICKQISEEGKPIRKVLLQEGMPKNETFYKWLDEDEEKAKQYMRACKKRADVIFEEIVTIADDQESDTYKNQDGVEVINHNVINRSRLRVDARKWVVSKMNPKKYGDRIEQDITLKGTLNYTTEERDKKIKELLKKKDAK